MLHKQYCIRYFGMPGQTIRERRIARRPLARIGRQIIAGGKLGFNPRSLSRVTGTFGAPLRPEFEMTAACELGRHAGPAPAQHAEALMLPEQ